MNKLKQASFYRSTRKWIKKNRFYYHLNIAGFFLRTKLVNLFQGGDLDEVDTFCLFIGHGRSGHSLIGALLDAHPNMIVSDETDILKYLIAGFDRKQLYRTLIFRSQKQTRIQRRKRGLNGSYYSYQVPNQWQGSYKKLTVVGDSKASVTARRLYETPALLEHLKEVTGCTLRIIHVVRNPYDNISTISIRENMSLEHAVDSYAHNCDALFEIRKHIAPDELLVIKHEDLIGNPKDMLGQLSQFLGVFPFEDYLDVCASIVYKSPSKTRSRIHWEEDTIADVKNLIARFDFLTGYSYCDD